MAVTPMKSVTIVGHSSRRTEILKVLHGLGVIQLRDIDGEMGAEAASAHDDGTREDAQQSHEVAARISETDRKLGEVSSCLNYISRWNRVQQGLVESFLAAKEDRTSQQWDAAGSFDYQDILAACHRGETRLGEIRTRELDLAQKIKDLQPLGALALDLDALAGTKLVAVFLGQANQLKLEAFESTLLRTGSPMHIARLGTIGKLIYFAVLYFREDAAVTEAIRTSGIDPASVPAAGMTARDAIAAAEAELASLAEERTRLAAEGAELVQHRAVLHTVYDRLLLEKQRLEAHGYLVATEKTFMLHGWCPSSQIDRVEKALGAMEDSVALSVRDPKANEQPPVTLDNQPLAKPFEIVTNIYGWPSYGEVDPTPVLAPFFAIFFAIALSDAVYGLIMMAYCIYMMSRKTTPKSAHKFFRLLTIGGFMTFVIGAVMGGWLGNALDFLPPYLGFITRFKNAIILFDPVKEPMTLMVISLLLGVVHLMTGIGIKMYMNIKAGRVLDALMDQGLWLVLLPSLGLMAAGSSLGAGVANAAKYVALAAVAGLVLTQGRAAKNIVGKVFSGLYSLYGLIGYLSDTLSYSRLLALGLATASLGMAINQIALMVRPVPFIGIFLMLAIMAFGHGLSLLINVFGAFIHSGRLQFIEFFTKFFEGGGKSFKPFAQRPRYTQVSDD